jgi:hypothetical protein
LVTLYLKMQLVPRSKHTPSQLQILFWGGKPAVCSEIHTQIRSTLRDYTIEFQNVYLEARKVTIAVYTLSRTVVIPNSHASMTGLLVTCVAGKLVERTCYTDMSLNLTTRRHNPYDSMNKDLRPEHKGNKNKMGHACSTYGGEESYRQGFGGET